MGLYRVLAGKHGAGAPGELRVFVKGDVVESDDDLAARYPSKFEALRDVEPASPGRPSRVLPSPHAAPPAPKADALTGLAPEPADDLDSFTVVQLREKAEAEEVDLHGLHKKDDIVAALRKAKVR